MTFRNLVVNLTLVFFSLLASLAASEIFVRQYYPQYKKTFQFHSELGITRIPNSDFQYFSDGTKINHKVNADGFKTPSITEEKQSGVFRVVLLGDSMTEAIQVPDSESFRAKLEEKLSGSLGRSAEVINLGYSGYGTAQEYLALKEFGLKYDPDVVILNFLADNDVANNSEALEDGESKPFFALQGDQLVQVRKPNKSSQGKLLSLITDRFVLPRFIYLKYQNLQAQDPIQSAEPSFNKRDAIYVKDYSSEWNAAWELTLALIKTVKGEAEANGADFILLSLASARQTVENIRNDYLELASESGMEIDVLKAESILSEFAIQEELNFVSSFDAFSNFSRNETLFVKNDGHLSPEGHQLLADLIFNSLLEKGLLDQ